MRRVGEMDSVVIGSSPNAAQNTLHAHTRRVFMGRQKIKANFEVFCYDEFNTCVNKEYFDCLADVREFVEAEETKRDYWWTSITPMNTKAHDELMESSKIS